jgi:hypothetical protein
MHKRKTVVGCLEFRRCVARGRAGLPPPHPPPPPTPGSGQPRTTAVLAEAPRDEEKERLRSMKFNYL